MFFGVVNRKPLTGGRLLNRHGEVTWKADFHFLVVTELIPEVDELVGAMHALGLVHFVHLVMVEVRWRGAVRFLLLGGRQQKDWLSQSQTEFPESVLHLDDAQRFPRWLLEAVPGQVPLSVLNLLAIDGDRICKRNQPPQRGRCWLVVKLPLQ